MANKNILSFCNFCWEMFIDGQMKKIQPPQWKEMKKTFKHYIENPLEHDHEEMQRMVRKSAESGNSKGRSIEDAC